MGFVVPAGDVIAAIRSEKGLTQVGLAGLARVSTSTVQRAERGKRVRAERLSQVASALAVSLADLQGTRLGVLDSKEIADEFTCRHCGAKLTDRVYVDHEYGDSELDRFECGAETGWRDRPCPKDPRFPAFEDYELRTRADGDRFYSYARGKTPMARAVDLGRGSGQTKQSAEKWVHRSYIKLRFGREEAERFMPFSEQD